MKSSVAAGGRCRLALLGALVGSLSLLAAGGRGGAATGPAPTGPAEERRLLVASWEELRFEAHKLFLGASTTVGLRFERLAEAGLRPAPEGEAVEPGAGRVAVVSLDSDLPFGRGERVTVWVDPITGAALQTERLATGSKPGWRLQRYLSDGAFSWRASPADDEEELGHERWSRRSERQTRWRGSAPDRPVVSDSYALLYLVSSHRFAAPGDELRLCVPAKDRLVEARFVAGEEITDRFDFEQVEGDATRRRSGEMRARVVRGLGRAVGSQASEADVDLGFLGMRGEITILLDPERVPLEIRGRAQGVGRVVVRLKRVVMAPHAPTEGS
jgi:hypothetical protein